MRIARVLLVAVAVCGCNVGPAYKRPRAPVPITSAYKESRAEGVWKVASPSDAMLRGKWWKVFGEPELDAFEDRLNVDNQTIRQKFDLYMAARAQIRAAEAGYSPTLTAGPSAGYGRNLGRSPGATFGAQVEASWAPDLFGRVRNTVREFQYGAQVSAADLEGQRLLEQATLAQTYFQIRGQDALQALVDATVASDVQILDVTRSQYETGIGTNVAVVQAEQTLEAARVQSINVGFPRAQFEHAIATLLGVAATDFSIPPRAVLYTPPPIPTGTPSQLLERRPDIAGAERQMAEANAVIGIGYSAYYPNLTLTGSGGVTGTALSTLVSWPSAVWAVGANLSQTVFDGGLRRANVAQYRAQYDATVANYRQTVLTAFQQVEDALAEVRILAQEVEDQKRLVALAEDALELERARYEMGVDPYLNLMTQQNILLSTRVTLVNLEVQEMTSAVGLALALGGGWTRSDLPPP